MNKTKKNQAAFGNLLAKLTSFYTQRPANLDLGNRTEAWFNELRRFELADVKEAITLVRTDSPQYFPKIGQLENACLRAAAKRKQFEAKDEQRAINEREAAAHAATLADVPADSIEQQEWIADGKTYGERLSRKLLVDEPPGEDAVAQIRLALDGRHPVCASPKGG